jgi:hypothetical protein
MLKEKRNEWMSLIQNYGIKPLESKMPLYMHGFIAMIKLGYSQKIKISRFTEVFQRK